MVFVFVIPFVLIVVFGLGSRTAGGGAVIGIVGGEGPVGTAILEELEARPGIELRRFDERAALERAVSTRTVSAGLYLPPDLGDGALDRPPATPTFLADVDTPAAGTSRVAVARAVAAGTALFRAAAFASTETGRPVGELLRSAGDMTDAHDVVVVGARTDVTGRPVGFDRTAGATLVLVVFLNSVAASGLLSETRRLGILDRMRLAPLGAGTLVAGSISARLVIATLQAVLIVVVSAIVFGVSWGAPLPVLAVIAAFTLVATGAGALVGATLRGGRQQVLLVAPPLAIAMGMLGGCMWPLWQVGPTLRALGHLTPHAWAVDALSDLNTGASWSTSVVTSLAVLVVIATALLVASALVLHKQFQTAGASVSSAHRNRPRSQ
jgi:ABC-2 type transport system permease protein